eukprot:CAMPEP_0114333992 /NCGR_PEP_ID=MMETSP0101-20121206/4097_1 /TAXON_ID=38822 ORGANISM="Pteridomonas danica, Strain PT" /NCGR_SAMPLE_ID=MMETSP0101 /ASSEMBLY_ACC=CAM_ASM_000211 /LENGTH=373 /DNA_ID=CAMNT_0001465141 /DNA_START=532 /DNA_END=1653 /DNA_ORIENTATION=+
MKASLTVWPIWHTINWVIIPQRYRVLGFNFGSLGWNTYLTYSMWMIEKSEKLSKNEQTLSTIETSPVISSPSTPSGTIMPKQSEQQKEEEEVKKACPYKFSAFDMSSWKHLCPHIKAKEEKERAAAAAADGGGSGSGAKGTVETKKEGKLPVPDVAASRPTTVPTVSSSSSSLSSPSSSPERQSWSSWLSSWVWKPPASCEGSSGENTDENSDAEKMLSSSDLVSILGSNVLLNANNEKIDIETLIGKTIVIYFSASWCPPCRRFTPILSETYHNVKREVAAKNEQVEFVLMSADTEISAYNAYRQKMPFLAVPFHHAETKLPMLKHFFQFRTIPHVVVILPNGTVSNWDAANDIYSDIQGKHFPWWKKDIQD